MNKNQIVDILREIAALLELTDDNPFRFRAYQNAARVLDGQIEDIDTLIRSGKLAELPGFGEHMVEKVTTLAETGRLAYYEDLRKKVPPGLLDMIQIPGVGPKKAKALYQNLGIDSVEKLKAACESGKVRGIPHFGAKTEHNIAEGLSHREQYAARHRYDLALKTAEALYTHLKDSKNVKRCEIAGSLRRHRETIGDIDIVASSASPEKAIAAFTKNPLVETIVSQGETRSSVRLKGGIQADLRVVSDAEFPFALYYFTGSKAHATAVRGRAKALGLKLNEYGLFKGKKRIACKAEADIFSALNLDYIEPELRENTGEFEAAETHKLPKLVEISDIRGVFHVHSDWSDGTAPLAEMIEKAEALGFAYVGISDHSRSATYAHGLDIDRVKKQEREIEKLRKRFKIRIFLGIESDILPDGSLDYPNTILERFDFVIASVHSSFKLSEKAMTERIITALRNPHTTMLGHLTGRLLLEREPYAVDVKRVIDAAADCGKAIELNAHPARFDIDWHWGPYLREKDVKVAINPDAHSLSGLLDYRYGVGIARKAWLRKSDVITTYTVPQIEKYLAQ